MKKVIAYLILPASWIALIIFFPKDISAIVETSINQQQTETQSESEDSNLQIRLHERFTKNNSSTTRIDQMNQNQLQNVNQFTLEETDKNKVEFKNKFDFSSEECVEKLNKLSEYVDMSTVGKVSIDTEYLNMLEGGATVTMYNLSYETTPLIYKDGKLVTNEEVSNITYVYSKGEKMGTLTFEVTGFSTYEAKENKSNTIYEVNDPIEESESPLTRILLLIGLITVQGIAVAVIVKLIEQKRLKKFNEEKDKKPKVESK